MSAVERMIAFHLARLKDKNPEVRVRSIEELALLKATEAFPVLEEIYRTDPEPEVRAAAQKAGKVLFLIIHQNDNSDSSEPPKD